MFSFFNTCVFQKTLPAIFEERCLSVSLLCLSKLSLKVKNGHTVQYLGLPVLRRAGALGLKYFSFEFKDWLFLKFWSALILCTQKIDFINIIRIWHRIIWSKLYENFFSNFYCFSNRMLYGAYDEENLVFRPFWQLTGHNKTFFQTKGVSLLYEWKFPSNF